MYRLAFPTSGPAPERTAISVCHLRQVFSTSCTASVACACVNNGLDLYPSHRCARRRLRPGQRRNADSGSLWPAVAFQWLGEARRGFSWLFGSRGGSALLFVLRCLSHTMFTTRTLNVLRWYTTPTTVLYHISAFTELLGLGVQLLVLHPELALLQRQLPRLPRRQPATTIEEAALGYASHNCVMAPVCP